MTKRSHVCEFGAGEIARIAVSLAGGIAAIALVLHALGAAGWLPEPVPDDLERTLLRAKARLALGSGPSDVILAGDSSCMMDVDAVAMGENLGARVLNLGTLSFLGLRSHAEIVAAHMRAHPARKVTVILLMHPDALRRPSGVREYEDYLEALLRGESAEAWVKPWARMAGAGLLRERVLQSWIPVMMPGDFGSRYGHQFGIMESLWEQRGSLVDPGRLDPEAERGSREFRLAAALESAARAFRAELPGPVRLAVGITPVPKSLAASDHEDRMRELLGRWAEWIGADAALGDLPAVWPDDRFASRTHLDADGARIWTRILTDQLEQAE